MNIRSHMSAKREKRKKSKNKISCPQMSHSIRCCVCVVFTVFFLTRVKWHMTDDDPVREARCKKNEFTQSPKILSPSRLVVASSLLFRLLLNYLYWSTSGVMFSSSYVFLSSRILAQMVNSSCITSCLPDQWYSLFDKEFLFAVILSRFLSVDCRDFLVFQIRSLCHIIIVFFIMCVAGLSIL